MKAAQIEIGKTYHNGKTGARSYSEREVLELSVPYLEAFTGIRWHNGVRYKQTAGRFKGETSVLSDTSFAKWAKGEVRP